MNVKLFGLKNCDATAAARKAMEIAGVEFEFHDIRKDGLNENDLRNWINGLGWENVLNKRSTTWKELPESSKKLPLNKESALRLILEHVTLMKRPVLDVDGKLFNGKEASTPELLKSLKK